MEFPPDLVNIPLLRGLQNLIAKLFDVALQAPEDQVIVLLDRGAQIIAATSNLGRVFELSPIPSATGWYESDVLDAKIPSKWGLMRWRVEEFSGVGIELYSRSGNTKVPDSSWADWQGPYTNAAGEHVKSPLARFLQ